MDNLPIELQLYIFKNYLNIYDLMNCRIVCKKWRTLASDWSLMNNLIINDRIDEFKNCWYFNNEFIDYSNAIKYSSFLKLKSIYKFETNLKRLHFNCLNKLDLDFNILNQLNQLEQLDLKIKFKLDNFNYELKIDNLKYLKLNYFNEDYGVKEIKCVIKLKTKNLIALKVYELLSISIENLNRIKYLEVNFYNENEMLNLKDCLEYYQCNIGAPNLNSNLLNLFPKLKKLNFNIDFSYFNDDEYNKMKRSLKLIIKHKINLKHNNLEIYFQGVRIENENKIDEFDLIDQTNLRFQLTNYDQLDNRLTSIYNCNYNELINLTTTIPNNFFKKYFKIKYCYTNNEINGSNHFYWFLSNLNQLKFLSLNLTSLKQSFYDRLSSICQLTHLIINENKLILNYNFILDFKLLEHFETNQRFVQSIDLTINALNRLKYLNYYQIANEFGPFIIQKIFKDAYTINCYANELSGIHPLTIHISLEFKFNQLIDQLPDFI